jgi:signal peptidase I
MNTAAEEKMNIQLSMAPITEAPVGINCLSPRKKRLPSFDFVSIFQQVGVGILIFLLSIGAYFAISHFLLQSVQVVGESMVPTLRANGHYLLNRWALREHNPQRRDVVVIRDPVDNGFSVKRVIALAGESVHFKDGKVYVNGKELTEPYLTPGTHTYTYSQLKEQFITCGKDQYFVLGDNRLKSLDSRYYGPVPRQNILGLVVLH